MIKRLLEIIKITRLYFVINMLKFKKCEHKFITHTVNITSDMSEQCNIMYSYINPNIYNKFIIPKGNTYQKCIMCGEINLIVNNE